jgi:endonuclease/exonuclease/phosphatase family metal-dependent hydrolase
LLVGVKTGVKYCTGAVAVAALGSENICVNKLHRVWLVEGCARRPGQKDGRDTLRCQPGYPYYNANYNNVAEDKQTLRDVCEKSKAISAVNEETGTPGLSTTTPPTNGGNTGTDGGSSTGNTGGDNSSSDDEEMPDDVASAFKIVFYKKTDFKGESLTLKVADSKLSQEWIDGIKSYKIVSGRWELCDGPGYNKDCVERWASDPDVTLSKRTGKLNAIVSVRPVITTTYEDPSEDVVPDCTSVNGTITQPNPDNTCPAETTLQCPTDYVYKDGECKEVVINEQASAPVDETFVGEVGKLRCLLLGREWIEKPSNDKIVNGGHYGCSNVTCNLHEDGAPKKNNGKPYCVSEKFSMPYAVEMKQEDCEELNRRWISQVGMCAQLPGPRTEIRSVVNADQCLPGYTTYYSFVAKGLPDKCFKASYVDRARGVAKATGGAFSTVLNIGPRIFCTTVKKDNFSWDKETKACKPDRQGGGSAFKIASFNIYYNTDESKRDYSINKWPERLQRSARVIKSNDIAVAGLQEVRESQWRRLQDKDYLGDQYGVYPRAYKNGVYASQNPIVWNKDRFELIAAGSKTIRGPHVTKDGLYADSNTQVELRDKATGQRLYVINTHEPVGNGGAIAARYNSAKARTDYVRTLAKEGKPIFLTGDFNAKYNPNNPRQQTFGDKLENMSYCILTNDTGLWDALDAARKDSGRCSAKDGPVDHVFLSRSVSVLKYDYNSEPAPQNGSDVHNTLIVNVVIKP